MRLSLTLGHAAFSEDRRARLSKLIERLGPQLDAIDWCVVADTERRGCWWTLRESLLWASQQESTHHIHLQDDAIPCLDFLGVAEHLHHLAPTSAINYYQRAKAVERARDAGTHWVLGLNGIAGPGWSWETKHCAPFLRWEAAAVDPAKANDTNYDDARVSLYLENEGVEVLVPAPNLVEHGAPMASVCGLNFPTKRANWWIGNESWREIDWTKGLDAPFATSKGYLKHGRKILR